MKWSGTPTKWCLSEGETLKSAGTIIGIVLLVVLVLLLLGGAGMMGFGGMGMGPGMMGGYGGYGGMMTSYGFNPIGMILALVLWALHHQRHRVAGRLARAKCESRHVLHRTG
jgi:hypothetical protein